MKLFVVFNAGTPHWVFPAEDYEEARTLFYNKFGLFPPENAKLEEVLPCIGYNFSDRVEVVL